MSYTFSPVMPTLAGISLFGCRPRLMSRTDRHAPAHHVGRAGRCVETREHNFDRPLVAAGD